MNVGDQIYIGTDSESISLFCRVNLICDDYFEATVINGCWTFKYYPRKQVLSITRTGDIIRDVKVFYHPEGKRFDSYEEALHHFRQFGDASSLSNRLIRAKTLLTRFWVGIWRGIIASKKAFDKEFASIMAFGYDRKTEPEKSSANLEDDWPL